MKYLISGWYTTESLRSFPFNRFESYVNKIKQSDIRLIETEVKESISCVRVVVTNIREIGEG